MEFKNCEERVLWELEQAENEIADLKHDIKILRKQLDDQSADIIKGNKAAKEFRDLLGELLVIRTSSTAGPFLALKDSYIYEKFDHDLYRRIVDNVPEIEVEER